MARRTKKTRDPILAARIPRALFDEIDRIANKSPLLDRSTVARILIEHSLGAGVGRRLLETPVADVQGIPA